MSKIDYYFVLSFLNLFLAITVFLNTVINFFVFVAAIILLIFACSILIKKKILNTGKFGVKFFYLVILPLCVNTFFTINYIISFNPRTETYCFKSKAAQVGGRGNTTIGKTTYVYLENNAYEYSYFTRNFYINYEKMNSKNEVVYTFKRGIFGLKVRKDFKFYNTNRCFDWFENN